MAPENELTCRVVTPERDVFEGDVESVNLPGADGNFSVLVDHTPYVAQLEIGEISLKTPGGTRYVACSGGFARVVDNVVTVLAETAELPEEIDIERAEAALERAKKRLKSTDLQSITADRAEDALRRAKNRLEVAGTE